MLECDTVRCLRPRDGVSSRGVFSVAESSSEASSPICPCRMRWGGWVLVGTPQSATESDGTRGAVLRLLLERRWPVVYGGGGSVSGKTSGGAGEVGSAILWSDGGRPAEKVVEVSHDYKISQLDPSPPRVAPPLDSNEYHQNETYRGKAERGLPVTLPFSCRSSSSEPGALTRPRLSRTPFFHPSLAISLPFWSQRRCLYPN